MKKSSSYLVNMILFLVLFSSSLQAQNPEIDREFTSFEEVKDYMNNIFSRLEKQRIPYGILLDKAVSISDITYFNGVYPKEERDTLDINTLFQVGSTLATAKITDNSAVVMPPEDMESVFDSFVSEESLVLGGVFYSSSLLLFSLSIFSFTNCSNS